MSEIKLQKMTRPLCHELYKGWQNDESIYMDMTLFKPYVYDEVAVNRYYDSLQSQQSMDFFIMLGERPIGEVRLKHIDEVRKTCTLSIHLQNDSVKNKGYGTKAVRFAVTLWMVLTRYGTVYADTVLKNTRSQHVLEKVGFVQIGEDATRKYYQCTEQTFRG